MGIQRFAWLFAQFLNGLKASLLKLIIFKKLEISFSIILFVDTEVPLLHIAIVDQNLKGNFILYVTILEYTIILVQLTILMQMDKLNE